MPTKRRRTSRQRDAGLSLQVRALFVVGCGWQSYGEAEAQRLWNEHGQDYLRLHPDPTCFALLQLGEPEG